MLRANPRTLHIRNLGLEKGSENSLTLGGDLVTGRGGQYPWTGEVGVKLKDH